MPAHRLFATENPKDDRPTPDGFFAPLMEEFGFEIDVAASVQNTKCKRFYTVDDDGLAQSWAPGPVWCNPPYSEIGLWVQKAAQEQSNGVTSVLLVPASTDVAWFHDFVLPSAEIRFVRGRLKFGNTSNRAPFASLILIFRGNQ